MITDLPLFAEAYRATSTVSNDHVYYHIPSAKEFLYFETVVMAPIDLVCFIL